MIKGCVEIYVIVLYIKKLYFVSMLEYTATFVPYDIFAKL